MLAQLLRRLDCNETTSCLNLRVHAPLSYSLSLMVQVHAALFDLLLLAQFLRRSGLSHLVRAHEVRKTGFQVQQHSRMVTLFSSSGYCGFLPPPHERTHTQTHTHLIPITHTHTHQTHTHVTLFSSSGYCGTSPAPPHARTHTHTHTHTHLTPNTHTHTKKKHTHGHARTHTHTRTICM